MPVMTGGEALAQSLYREGVRVVFGLPGVQIYHALDGLAKEPGIRFITTRHEQATTYMADGYARAGGGIAAALVVPGPGLLNAAAGIGTAYAASSPVMVVSGQINSDLIGKDVGVLHEVRDQLSTVAPITKWRSEVREAGEVPSAVHQAFLELRTGRPRPVVLEIPPDVLAQERDVELLEPGVFPPLSGDPAALEEAANALSNAARPVIWAGGGVITSGASAALCELAELLQAPVITTGEGKGAISDAHYLSLGVARGPKDPLRELFQASDLVLAVGTRFATAQADPRQQVVQVDIDPEEVGRNHERTLGVVADARMALEQLCLLLKQNGHQRASRREEAEGIRSQRYDPAAMMEPQASFVRALRAAMPEDGVLVTDMTQVGYYSRPYFPIYHPRTYLTSSYFGNLGYAYPTALGAKVACPDKAVVAVCGDGGFLYNSQELATAVLHSVGTIAVVFRDDAYGNVLRDQENRFEGRVVGSRLHNPDFVKLAQAYGADGVRAHDAQELERALAQAIERDRPALIEVPVGPMPSGF